MLKCFKNFDAKKTGLFAAGVLFGTAGIKILSSKDAKKLYTNCTAAVLRAKEVVLKTATKVQENAEDIYAEAVQINEDRAAKAAQEFDGEVEAEAAETAANAAGTADVADKKVGISIYKFDDNFMTLYRQELQRYLTEDLGFKAENVVIQDGKGDQAEQTNQINNFITQKYDVLILNLVQASSAPEITDMCKEAGIPVVYINREPDEAEEQRWVDEKINATYVGCDARQSGTYQGEEILETETKGDINGDGKVSYIMIQGDPENVDAQYRTEFSVKAAW